MSSVATPAVPSQRLSRIDRCAGYFLHRRLMGRVIATKGYVEPLARLNIQLGYGQKLGTGIGFALIH